MSWHRSRTSMAGMPMTPLAIRGRGRNVTISDVALPRVTPPGLGDGEARRRSGTCMLKRLLPLEEARSIDRKSRHPSTQVDATSRARVAALRCPATAFHSEFASIADGDGDDVPLRGGRSDALPGPSFDALALDRPSRPAFRSTPLRTSIPLRLLTDVVPIPGQRSRHGR